MADTHNPLSDFWRTVDENNWTTTGMDSDYEDYVPADEKKPIPLNPLNFPQVKGISPHIKSISLFEDMWIYLKRKLLGEPK